MGIRSSLSPLQRASVYAGVFTVVICTAITLIPMRTEFKILTLLIYGSYVFTYLFVSDRTEAILWQLRVKGSRVEARCHNTEIIRQEEEDGVCKMTVRCRVGRMGRNGCPLNCPGFRRPAPTGTGAIGGALLGGIVGTVFLPTLGTVLGGLLGAIFGHAIEDTGLRSQLEIKVDECKINHKIPHIYYVY